MVTDRASLSGTPVLVREEKYVFSGKKSEPAMAYCKHNEPEFIIVTKGECSVSIDGSSQIMKKNDVAFINPHELHSMFFSGESDSFSVLSLVFDVNLTGGRSDDPVRMKFCEPLRSGDIHLNSYYKSTGKTAKKILPMLRRIANESKKMNENWELAVKGLFCLILFEMNGSEGTSSSSKTVLQTAKYKDFTDKVSLYISENIHRKISLSEIASVTGYSKGWFERMFKSCFSMTFTGYLNVCRTDKAKKLLAEGSYSTDVVSALCGFATPEYFSDVFKQYTGMTPDEFRILQEDTQTNLFDT